MSKSLSREGLCPAYTERLLERMPRLPTLELRCLGAPTARVDGKEPPSDVLWRKNLALLAYLAFSPNRTRTRDHLIGLLWPEKPERDARHSFSEAVRRLRQSLGEDRLVTRGELVELEAGNLEVDALRFLETADRDSPAAISLYAGDFFDGFAVDDAPAFEEWVSSERARLRTRAVALLLATGEGHLSACRLTEAQDVARRVLTLQPYHEPAARLLIQATALAGDVTGALAAYREFGERVAREVGEKQSRTLDTLAGRIRSNSWRPAAARGVEEEAPLVGRATAHSEAFASATRALNSGSSTTLIAGAPGMGRTRLLQECVARIALEGAAVATARPLGGDADTEWSTLNLLFRNGLATIPGLAGASPDALAVLAAVAPDFNLNQSRKPPRDISQVASALADALKSASEEQPVGIGIDDAHLADRATLNALLGAFEQLRNTRVALLLTVPEPIETAPPELLRLRGEIGRGLPGTAIRLAPLEDTDLADLTRRFASWCQDDSQRDRLTRRLMAETKGNPFFAVTLLRGLERMASLRQGFVAWPGAQVTFDQPLPFSVPDIVGTAVAARLVELDKKARQVLAAATIGGAVFDLDLMASLTGLPRTSIEDGLAAAERRHLVTFDGGRYTFTAPLIAEVVRRECVTAGQRQTLTLRAVALLESKEDFESRLLRVELRARAEPAGDAFSAALEIGREAEAAGAVRAASRALAAAQLAAGKAPGEDQQRQMKELREVLHRRP